LESLSLTDLTIRPALLLALSTAQRGQTLSKISLPNIHFTYVGVEVAITDLIKTSKPGVAQPLLRLPYFDNHKLCVASTLQSYLDRTNGLRGNCSSLFITTRPLHQRASLDSLRRWLKAGLMKFGVSSSFGAHSTRHAATSGAFQKGVSVDEIAGSGLEWR